MFAFMQRGGYVYILMNKSNTVIYIGVTSDLVSRIFEHREMLHEGFTKRYLVTKLVYFEHFDFITEAIAREKKLKGSSRRRKLNLIVKDNPDFKDLMDQLNDW